MMHKALHHGDDIDRLYESRKEERRRHTSIEDSIDALKRRLYKKEKRKTNHNDQKKKHKSTQGSTEQQ